MALGRSPVTETLANVSIIIFTLEFCPFTQLEGAQGHKHSLHTLQKKVVAF